MPGQAVQLVFNGASGGSVIHAGTPPGEDEILLAGGVDLSCGMGTTLALRCVELPDPAGNPVRVWVEVARAEM